MAEAEFIARLRAIATDPAARGLADDAAVLGDLVLTHDMIVEGVHYLPSDPPADVAWKLVAVNLSDLAAKGAVPAGVLLGYPLGDADWDAAFVDGLGVALAAFGTALLGGDTVSAPRGAPRMIGMTALGRSPRMHPIDAARGPAMRYGWSARSGRRGRGSPSLGAPPARPTLLAAYRRPQPLLAAGSGDRAPCERDGRRFRRAADRRRTDRRGLGAFGGDRSRCGVALGGAHRLCRRRSRRAARGRDRGRRLCADLRA